MRGAKLDLSALQTRLWPRLSSRAEDGALLSRRQLLGAAGLLAVSLLPSVGRLKLPWYGPFSLTAESDRVALRLGDHERFVIHTANFAGSPALRCTEQDEGYRVELTGARYPGTKVAADLVADLTRHNGRWTLDLHMAFGGFRAVVSLEDWLAGVVAASSDVIVTEPLCRMAGGACVAGGGAALAEFRPDWTLRLHGPAISTLASVGGWPASLLGNSIRLSLLTPLDPSIMRRPARQRSLLTVERGAQEWSLLPGTSDLTVGARAFDTLHVEAGESAGGRLRHALVAEGGGSLQYRPEGGEGTDGAPLTLTLASPRLAVAGDEAVLTARFSDRPVWVRGPGIHYLVGHTPEAEPFTAVWREGALEQVTCAPAVLAAAAPLEGAVTQVHLPPKSRAVFALGPVAPTRPVLTIPQDFVSLSVLRTADLLNLRFEGRNLVFQSDGQGGSKLARRTAGQPAYLIVLFPPQHIAEETFDLTGPDEVSGATAQPAKARLAGPSRLVFALPHDHPGIPYTLEGLLSWESLVPSVAPNAKAPLVQASRPTVPAAHLPAFPATPAVAAPAETHTAIEAPLRLILSPNQYAAWAHASSPVTAANWTELWHTRLAVRGPNHTVDEARTDLRKVRAIWSPDWEDHTAYHPFEMALGAFDRQRIVGRTARWANGEPMPVPARRLMLSALGAWLDLHGKWSESSTQSLREWRHLATQGRDHFVKVVSEGFLFPFRHPAIYLEIADRRIITREGKKVAYLTSRKYIVVQQPEMDYTELTLPKGGREWPFKSVTILTPVTPYLSSPGSGIHGVGEAAFWPKVGEDRFLFKVAARDAGGNDVTFAVPMAFIAKEYITNSNVIVQGINDLVQGVGQVEMGGQRVHYASSAQRGDTEFETSELVVGGGRVSQQPAGLPQFYPTVAEAAVRIPAMAQLSDADSGYKNVRLATAYKDHGFGSGNPGAVYLEMVSSMTMNMAPSVSGGLVAPRFAVSGISRKVGLVGGDVSAFAAGSFDPSTIFTDANATLLGGIKLQRLLPAIGATEFVARSAEVPTIKTNLYRNGEGKPTALETQFAWTAPVQPVSEGFVAFTPNSNPAHARSVLHTMVRSVAHFDNASRTQSVDSSLNNFSVTLMGAVRVQFNQLKVVMQPEQKPAVQVDLAGVFFEGALSWVSVLTQFMQKLGLGGFDIDVDSSGLRMVQSVGPLNVQLGMLALMDVNLRTVLTLPFVSGKAASLAFNVGTEDAPCGLTVSFLGGQAYFGLIASTSGLEVRAMFGFGGCIAFDIGVASGKAEIMACITFGIGTDNQVMVGGELRCGGALRVLKLITISVVFVMGLRYENGKVLGSCQVKVKVSVAFFEKSVSLSLERRFAGSAGDPTFADLMTETDWQAYCQAFD